MTFPAEDATLPSMMLMTSAEDVENVTVLWMSLTSSSMTSLEAMTASPETSTSNKSLTETATSPNASGAPWSPDEAFDWSDAMSSLHENEPSVLLRVLNYLGALEGVLGVVLCALILAALKRKRNAAQISAWCLGNVIVLDLANSLRQIYSCASSEIRVTEMTSHPCMLLAAEILMIYWTSLPASMSLVVLGVDQLLAVFFPLAIRLQRKDLLKKLVYALVTWSPSAIITSVTFGTAWLGYDVTSCQRLFQTMTDNSPAYGRAFICAICVNVFIYVVLLGKIATKVFHSKLHKIQREEKERKQARLICVFFVVFLTSVVFWMPPFLGLSFRPACMGDDFCRRWNREIWSLVQMFFAFNSIFDPLYLGGRFNLFQFCRE